MLDSQDPANLSRLIYECIQGEKKIESFRVFLSEKYDFSPLNFFSILTNSSSVSSRDLKNFLTNKKIEFADSSIFMTIKQYSCLQNGRLSYEDFCQIVLPSTNLSLRDRTLNRPLIKTNSDLTMLAFVKVIQEEILLQGQLEEIKEELYREKDFSVYKAFESIAKGNQVIEEWNLKEYLKKNQRYVNEEDIDALLRRVDNENDGVISYNEFLEFLIPFNVPEKKNNEADTLELTQKNEENSLEETQPVKEKNDESEIFIEIPRNEENSETKKEVKIRLLEFFLAVRFEEFKKEEIAMLKNFSGNFFMQVLGSDSKDSITVKSLATILSVEESDIRLITKNSNHLSEKELINLISPFNAIYKPSFQENVKKLDSDIEKNFLISALNAVISSQKILVQLLSKASELAEFQMNKEFITNMFEEMGIDLKSQDFDLILSRIELIR